MSKLCVAILFLAAAGGCSGSSPPPGTQPTAQPAGALESGRHAHGSTDGTDDEEVAIDPRLQRLCDLPTPRFGFDRADMDGAASRELDALADCLVRGPARHVRLSVVGHADPRGELYYNFGLGQRRAGRVATYLARHGVEDERLETSSRGELDANGTDERGWVRDRKVEIWIVD